MSRDINKLFGPFQTGIRILIKRANDAGIPAFVTDTTRTEAQQRRLVAEGKSYTMESKHLIGEAADIAFTVDGKLSYDRELYKRLYAITKDIPFVIWPYKDLGWNWDWPHHEYDKTKEGVILEGMTEEERKLNTEIGRVTKERDKFRNMAAEEQAAKQDNYHKWQKCLDEPRCGNEKELLKQIHESTKDYG